MQVHDIRFFLEDHSNELPGKAQQGDDISLVSGEGPDVFFINAMQFFLLVERNQIHQFILLGVALGRG
ncbi:hypothetical protein D3C78_1942470 [compost metagenome]